MVGFARMNGRTVGVVGNQPTEAAGKNHLLAPATFTVKTRQAFILPLFSFS